jgi:histidine ammonia-lyase
MQTQPLERIVLRSPSDLTIEILEDIAWENRTVRLHQGLLDHLASSRAAIEAALAGQDVYGVTTGMGYLSDTRLTADEQRSHQRNLLLGRAVGGPPHLDRPEARAVLVARLAGFLGGQAGVTPDLCRFLVDRLNDGFVPAIPRTGAGSAGEIIPLAHAFQTFLGVGSVLRSNESLQDAADALAERGVAPYEPAAKEGIALLAGAPGTLALAAAHCRAGHLLLGQIHVAWACAMDAIQAPLGPYDQAIAHLAHDPLLGRVLARLWDLLRGSKRGSSRLQAPVSFRVIPQLLTHQARTLERVEEDVRREVGAVTDSPAFVDGQLISTGGFHAVGLATDLDLQCIALIQAAELSAQHIHRLLDRRFSGLPDQLTARPGPRAGLVAVHKRAIGTANELRRFAAPATVGLTDTSMGQEDAMTFAFEAADKLRRVEELVREVLACELLVCRQAWALRSSLPAEGLAEYVRLLIELIAPVDEDRPLGNDIAKILALLREGRFA